MLVWNEWFTPAWKVRSTVKSNRFARKTSADGVLLPAGKNRVEFEYSTTLFRVLTALNRITILLLLAFAILVIMRNALGNINNGRFFDRLYSDHLVACNVDVAVEMTISLLRNPCH